MMRMGSPFSSWITSLFFICFFRWRITVNVVPLPHSLETLISPPSIFTMLRVIAMPSPVPGIFSCLASSARSKGKNKRSRNSGVIPIPLSLKANWNVLYGWDSSWISNMLKSIVPPSGVYLMALDIRLVKICCRRRGSPMMSSWTTSLR